MTLEKNNKAFYSSVHYWLKYSYGVASKCENSNCLKKSKNYAWAKLKEKEYDYNRNNFIQLCYSCHFKYDFTEESRKNMRNGNRNTHKEYCKRGHKFDAINTYKYISKKGNVSRRCRTCDSEKGKRFLLTEAYKNKLRNVRKNHDRILEYEKKYREKNRIKLKKYGMDYRHKKRASILSAKREGVKT